MLIKNKKGELSIVILVLLILLLTMVTLFTFAKDTSKIEAEISDAKFLQDSYVKENNVENYLSLALESAIIESYKEIITKGNEEYVGDPAISNSQKEIMFNNLADDIDSIFLEKIKEKFIVEFLGYDYEENYLVKAELHVDSENFEITFAEDSFKIILEELTFIDSYEDISWAYATKIQTSSSLNKLGLESFEKIYEVKEKCKQQSDIQKCFNDEISNFEVVVEGKKDSSDNEYDLVKFTSEKEFLINNNFEKINFEFVLD